MVGGWIERRKEMKMMKLKKGRRWWCNLKEEEMLGGAPGLATVVVAR